MHIMIMHDAVRALHVITVCWKTKCDVKTLLILPAYSKCARHHNSPLKAEVFNF